MHTYNAGQTQGGRASEKLVDSKGFSLIELLVVVIIIGILAAIAIPTYLGQQEQARSAAVQTDLRNAGTAATLCYAKANGSYKDCGSVSTDGKLTFPSGSDNFGFRQSSGVVFSEPDDSQAASWSIQARYGTDGQIFKYDTQSGRVSAVASPPGP